MASSVITQNAKLIQISGAIIALLVATGLADGRLEDATASHEKLTRISELLASLPLNCGDWTGTSLDMESEELRISEATGAVLRHYKHRFSGDSVTVLLLAGLPGPISVHPPTACYRARGYRLTDEPRKVIFEDGSIIHEALAAEFLNPAGFAEDRVGITWCWTADGHWTAPENPRLEFADEPVLIKLYITWDRGGDSRLLETSIPQDFFHSFKDCFKEHLSHETLPPDSVVE